MQSLPTCLQKNTEASCTKYFLLSSTTNDGMITKEFSCRFHEVKFTVSLLMQNACRVPWSAHRKFKT